SAVADTVDLHHARTDGRAEHDEIQRSGNHRRGDALHQGTEGTGHFETIDGANGIQVHARASRLSWTRLTKISSSELWLVCRSRKSIPSSPSRRSSPAIPVCSLWLSKV